MTGANRQRGRGMTTITFIGAGSTVFTKNLAGDILSRPGLREATLRLMDIDAGRLAESAMVVGKLARSLGAAPRIETHEDRRRALDGADFVIVSFQIGGYRPATVTDFEVPKRHGLRQTIADTLGVGGIMRGVRTVPHLWAVAGDMAELCPDAVMLQYVNPMAINTWALSARFPKLRQLGLCHSVQNTAEELAHDLDLPRESLRFRSAGINHMAFFLHLEEELGDGARRDLYPALREGYRAGRLPKPPLFHERCPNRVRYEVMCHLGYFPTESSEHFAEYVPWFIKRDRPDLIERFGIPLDEYPRRCEEQIAAWKQQAEAYRAAGRVEVTESHEYAADIIEAQLSGRPAVVHANIANRGYIPQLPTGAAVEVPVLIDAGGAQPTVVDDIPPQLIALMRTNVNVQELTVAALMEENPEHIHHAAMMDPHTAAEMDLGQIRALVDDLRRAHGDWLPEFARLAG